MNSNDIAWIEVEIEKSQRAEQELRDLLEGLESSFPAAILRKMPSWLKAKKFLQELDGARPFGIGHITCKDKK